MSSSIFRQIEATGSGGAGERAERLFKAAVSAFCSLPRPSRHDIQQLDDLAIPLFDRVSAAGRRFAAAALSECASAPPRLLERLCESGIEVAAPLLIRSPALSDADLVSLIARHGLPYAQAIHRRRNLHPAIAGLLRAVSRPQEVGQAETVPQIAIPLETARPAEAEPSPAAGSEDRTRNKLRAMMRPAAGTRLLGGRTAFLRLRDTALAGRAALFHTALADSLGIWVHEAAACAENPGELALAFRALGLKEEEAFLLLALTFPQSFAGAGDASRFLDHYAGLPPETVEASLLRWRAERVGRAPRTVRAR